MTSLLRSIYVCAFLLLMSCTEQKQIHQKVRADTIAAAAPADTLPSNGQGQHKRLPYTKDSADTVLQGWVNDEFIPYVMEYYELDEKEKRKLPSFSDTSLYSGDGSVYYKTKDKKVICLYGASENSSITAKYVDIDGKGSKEIWLNVQTQTYGTGGGTGMGEVILIGTDTVPTVLFHALNLCYEESFGDRWNEGEGAFYHVAQTEIELKDQVIYVGEPQKDEAPDIDCELSPVKAGQYIFRRGRIGWAGEQAE